ncbi:MAG: hypothetical protein JXR48_17375 [Candidatus Delongbacteria bacterium]|nr:hypothetical protein [Candidatus Delongbacteria bacterium]MBN2836731.1 hypothetical protein [Candidatus Delongbacteria bacterium]
MKTKILVLICLLPFIVVSGKYGAYKDLREYINKKTEIMKTYPIEKLYHSLEVASKNYKKGNEWDVNILVPMNIILEKENSHNYLTSILLSEEKYNTYVRNFAIEGLGELGRKNKINKNDINEVITTLEKFINNTELNGSIRKSLVQIIPENRLLKWLNEASSTEDKWRIIGYFHLTKSKISKNIPLYLKVKELAFNKNEDPKIRAALIGHISITFDFGSKDVIREFTSILNDQNELDYIKALTVYSIAKFDDKENLELIFNTLLQSNSPFVWENCIYSFAMIKSHESAKYVDKLIELSNDIEYMNQRQNEIDTYYENQKFPDLIKLNIDLNNSKRENKSIVESCMYENEKGRTKDIKENFSNRLPKLFQLRSKVLDLRSEWEKIHVEDWKEFNNEK